MGILKLLSDSFFGTLSDQFKDIITTDTFDELTVVKPGYLKSQNKGRGVNDAASNDVLSNGSLIFVPENTAAIVYSQGFIENIITKPGRYEYQNGEKSIFNGDDVLDTIFDQVKGRIRFGGISSEEKKISFVNLREIRGILFGTNGSQIYHDKYYDADLEVIAHGSFSIQIVDIETFLKKYLPANSKTYTFDDINSKAQVIQEFTNSLIVAINDLSNEYRIVELPARSKMICDTLKNEKDNVGSWKERYGFEITNVAIESIELTDKSRELVNKFNESRMSTKVYENINSDVAGEAVRQKVAEGVKENGLGGGGVILGMNMAETLNTKSNDNKTSVEKQVEILKSLKELLDNGVITEEEFEMKKKEVIGIK